MIVWDRLKIANTNATNGISIEPSNDTTLQVSGDLKADSFVIPTTEEGKTFYVSSTGFNVNDRGITSLQATSASVIIGSKHMAAANTSGLQVQNGRGTVTLNVLPTTASSAANPISNIFLNISRDDDPKLALGYMTGQLYLFKDLSNSTTGYASLFAKDITLTGSLQANSGTFYQGTFTHATIDNLTINNPVIAPARYDTMTSSVTIGHNTVTFDVVIIHHTNLVTINFISQGNIILDGRSYTLPIERRNIDNCTKIIYKQLSFHNSANNIEASVNPGIGSIIGITTYTDTQPEAPTLLTGITIAGDTYNSQTVCGTIQLIP